MDNKVENVDLMEVKSGVTDQTEAAPAIGAGEDEGKVTDSEQAEPLPGDQSGQGDDDTTLWALGQVVVQERVKARSFLLLCAQKRGARR